MKFIKNVCFCLILLFSSFTYAEEKSTPNSLTPNQELEQFAICGQQTSSPLSQALPQLIRQVGDQHFTQEFFDSIAKLEKQKYNGEYTARWDNDQIKLKANFKNGKVDGHVHGWYDDGLEAFKAFFYEEVKVGIHIAFYPKLPRQGNSRIGRLLTYDLKGNLHGEQQADYSDGRLKSFAVYKNGLLNGPVSCWDHGKCLKDEFYKEGKLKEKKT